MGLGSIYFIPLGLFGFAHGGFAGVGGVIITVLSHSKRLGELSGPLFFSLGAICVSHRFIYFFSDKILTSCRKAAHFPSPISLITDACTFFKNFPISVTSFVMAPIADTKGILVDCRKF